MSYHARIARPPTHIHLKGEGQQNWEGDLCSMGVMHFFFHLFYHSISLLLELFRDRTEVRGGGQQIDRFFSRDYTHILSKSNVSLPIGPRKRCAPCASDECYRTFFKMMGINHQSALTWFSFYCNPCCVCVCGGGCMCVCVFLTLV